MIERHKVITAIALVSFPIWIFVVFDMTFATCYIDDGCGTVDPFVPYVVLALALTASILSGWLAAIAWKFLRFGDN